jgi:hypothetical protein
MTGDRHDEKTIYCRRLGHDVPFAYCRQGSHELPCAAILGCWQQRLPITDILAGHYSPEQLRRAFRPPQDKLSSILDILARLRAS